MVRCELLDRRARNCPLNHSEFAQDHAELGAGLNGFSLNEQGALAPALEKTGQAIDATYVSTAKLVCPF